jgi:hypothetical protein
MDTVLDSALQNLWQHVTSDRQAWLFGAGISYSAGIPLMTQLTAYVETLVEDTNKKQSKLLKAVREHLPEQAHVEHVLSQIGDLIALAERSRNKAAYVGKIDVAADELKHLHALIVTKIGYAVRYGFRPANGKVPELRGEPGKPIVQVHYHREFIKQLLAARGKPGVGQSPINFFTTNYDTLLEDALALERVHFVDGFLGGAMAFWSPAEGYVEKGGYTKARVVKLHGSVDWHLLTDGALVRCRDGCAYPDKVDNLMIYPQSTKYVATQKDPFASLFTQFRQALTVTPSNVLGICGYSFGDEHINDEIEAAMAQPNCKTVVVAFASEINESGIWSLPRILREWLDTRHWSPRLFVATNRGLYHGSSLNLYPPDTSCDWWTFEGLTKYLSEGPETITAPMPPAAPVAALEDEVAA